MEEFGVTNNQSSTYALWWNTVISSGLTGTISPVYDEKTSFSLIAFFFVGDLIWQAGSELSTGPSPNDGYAVYPTGTVYPVMESAAAALKQRG